MVLQSTHYRTEIVLTSELLLSCLLLGNNIYAYFRRAKQPIHDGGPGLTKDHQTEPKKR